MDRQEFVNKQAAMKHWYVAIPCRILNRMECEYIEYQQTKVVRKISLKKYREESEHAQLNTTSMTSAVCAGDVGRNAAYRDRNAAARELYLQALSYEILENEAYNRPRRFLSTGKTTTAGPICILHVILPHIPEYADELLEHTAERYVINPTIDDIIAAWAYISIDPSTFMDPRRRETLITLINPGIATDITTMWYYEHSMLLDNADRVNDYINKGKGTNIN